MSSNKKTKLYTEEEVKMLLDKMSLVTERKNLGVSANFRHRAIEIDNLLKYITPIELPSDKEIEPVMAVIEDCDWYIVPSRLYEDFRKDTYNEKLVDSGQFDGKWGNYKTGGDLNSIQLYSKIK